MRDWLVHIRRNEQASLQTQIREALVAAILDGQLAREEAIPSTRRMAKSLGVSRNTVVLAYDDSGSSPGRFTGFSRSTDGGATWSAPVSVKIFWDDDTPGSSQIVRAVVP